MPEKGLSGPRLTKLGRYEVLNELGKGAMGVVYLAKDPVIGRMVAIKTIRTSSFGEDDSESREFRERFIREAQTAGILSHPNIVTIHDIGEDPETQTSFIAMEYIEGRNLKSLLLEKNKFTYDQIADIIAQVGEALDYAHRKGIIHRDIKPANIIITTDGKVKIMDFGIAKIASSNLTTTGQFLGTPNYMSPEQVSGAAVDGRSDIFSLGVVLYELLTSRKPFQGENLTAISYKIVHEDFTPPAELAPEVPPDFNAIVARAMAKDPWNRYQRGKDIALALHQLKARLEEQRALRDLGASVAAAENMPTLRLENLDKLASEGGVPVGGASVLPPEDHADMTEDSGVGAARRPTVRSTPVASLSGAPEARTVAIPVGANLPPPPEAAASTASGAPGASARLTPSSERPTAEAPSDAGSALPPTRPLPTSPSEGPSVLARVREMALRYVPEEWRKWLAAEVNAPYFWATAGAVAFFFFVVCGALVARASIASRPTAPLDPAVWKETQERKQNLAEAKKLFSAGKYDASLALLRQVLARSPGNTQARQYAQMAENAIAGRAEDARRRENAQQSLESAKTALAEKRYDDAIRLANDTLALDGGQVEAQGIRDQADEAKRAEARQAALEASKKKKEEKKTIAAKKATAAPRVAEKSGGTSSAAAAAPAPDPSGPSSLHLLFDSPLSEGNLIVYVNGARALQKSFDFSKKAGLFKRIEGTGTVDETLRVKPGPNEVKVWLSGKGLSAAAFATATAQVGGGETKVLRLEYASGQLAARVQ